MCLHEPKPPRHGAASYLSWSLRPQPIPSEAFPGQRNSILFSLRTGVNGCLRSLARKNWFQWAFRLLPSLLSGWVIPSPSVKLEPG